MFKKYISPFVIFPPYLKLSFHLRLLAPTPRADQVTPILYFVMSDILQIHIDNYPPSTPFIGNSAIGFPPIQEKKKAHAIKKHKKGRNITRQALSYLKRQLIERHKKQFIKNHHRRPDPTRTSNIAGKLDKD